MQQQTNTNDPNDDPGVVHLTPEEREWLAQRNVASIEAVPAAVWARARRGTVPRRDWALRCARRGYDVYAYCSGGEHGIWNLWWVNQRIELGREQ